MSNEERKKGLEIKIREKEDKLEHCASLVDELELLLEIDDLYNELHGDTFLGNEISDD